MGVLAIVLILVTLVLVFVGRELKKQGQTGWPAYIFAAFAAAGAIFIFWSSRQ